MGLDVSPTLESLETQLNELTDLFRRRLLEDKVKQRAFDELYDQLQFARTGLSEQFMTPLVREVLMVCDRIEEAADTSTVMGSVRDELLEVFRRRGLEEIDATGKFDPRMHESVGTRDVDQSIGDGTILSMARSGYRFGDRVLRPAKVLVARYVAVPSAEATGPHTEAPDSLHVIGAETEPDVSHG